MEGGSSHFKKARPKRALHYRDYQLPDHLYSLRENSNKRHTPNVHNPASLYSDMVAART